MHALLGGPCRERVRVYANGWFEGASTPDEFAAAAAGGRSAGLHGAEVGPFHCMDNGFTEREIGGSRSLRRGGAGEAVGDDVDICVEVHGRLNVTSAIAAAEALRPYRPFFYEEPLRPDNPAAYAKLAQAQIGMPIAAGERFFTRWGFPRIHRTAASRYYPAGYQPHGRYSGGQENRGVGRDLRHTGSSAQSLRTRGDGCNPSGGWLYSKRADSGVFSSSAAPWRQDIVKRLPGGPAAGRDGAHSGCTGTWALNWMKTN